MRRPAGLPLVLAALALDGAACYALAGAVGARNDLFPRWLATRLWLTTGQDLYSPATDDAIRAALGAVPLGGSSFVFGFVYPAYLALLLAPLALLPFRAAATVWLLFIQASAVGGALLAWRASERERGLPAISPLPALVAAALMSATVLNVIFLQFSSVILLALAACWWLLVCGHERRAAATMLLAAVKPQLALLSVAALLLHSAARSRWRFVAVALGGALCLGLVSLLLFPGWPERFAASTLVYASEARPSGAVRVVAGQGQWVVGLAVAVLVGLTWWRSARTVGETLGASALLSVWLIPPLYEWNSVILLLVLTPALRSLRQRGATAAWVGCAALVSASLVTLWLISVHPSESRAVWPATALSVYLAPVLLGSHRLTSSAPAPSDPVRA